MSAGGTYSIEHTVSGGGTQVFRVKVAGDSKRRLSPAAVQGPGDAGAATLEPQAPALVSVAPGDPHRRPPVSGLPEFVHAAEDLQEAGALKTRASSPRRPRRASARASQRSRSAPSAPTRRSACCIGHGVRRTNEKKQFRRSPGRRRARPRPSLDRGQVGALEHPAAGAPSPARAPWPPAARPRQEQHPMCTRREPVGDLSSQRAAMTASTTQSRSRCSAGRRRRPVEVDADRDGEDRARDRAQPFQRFLDLGADGRWESRGARTHCRGSSARGRARAGRGAPSTASQRGSCVRRPRFLVSRSETRIARIPDGVAEKRMRASYDGE